MSKAKFIHLATHAIVDDLRPLGIIALAPSENDDGILRTEELFDMFGLPEKQILPAELLVLSACETGKGKITGDGVIGLSRTLILAGASRVIVSLWEVDDLATTFLMIKFYEILNNYVQLEPLSIAQALRQAQKWLEGLNNTQAKQEFEKLQPIINESLVGENEMIKQAHIETYEEKCDQAHFPFANPRYWAAFTTIGF